jgi:predicted peptidase
MDSDYKVWTKDPWGCKGMRNKIICDRILSKADKMNEKQKIKLLYQLGKPDTLEKRKEWVVYIYHFGGSCSGTYNDLRTKDGRLEVFQDSTKGRTIFGVEYY